MHKNFFYVPAARPAVVLYICMSGNGCFGACSVRICRDMS